MPDFPIVDAHVHLADPKRFGYGWTRNAPSLNRTVLPEHLTQAAGPVKIERFVFVEVDVDLPQHLDEAAWIDGLADKCFRGWPLAPPLADLKELGRKEGDGPRIIAAEFTTQEAVRLRFYGMTKGKPPFRRAVVKVLDEESFPVFVAAVRSVYPDGLDEEAEVLRKIGAPTPENAAIDAMKSDVTALLDDPGTAVGFFAPRGLGFDAWNPPAKVRQHVARKFMLLGQTVEAMRAWDIRWLVEVLSGVEALQGAEIELHASGNQAVNTLYAAATSEGIDRLVLSRLPASHRDGPDYLNVLRVLDIPQTVAIAADKCQVTLTDTDATKWTFPLAVAKQLGWGSERLMVK